MGNVGDFLDLCYDFGVELVIHMMLQDELTMDYLNDYLSYTFKYRRILNYGLYIWFLEKSSSQK